MPTTSKVEGHNGRTQEQQHQINKKNMETTAKVLETMRSAGKPVSAGEVATLGRNHRITCPLQVAAGRVRSDL